MINEGKFGLFEAVCFTTIIIISKLFYTNISRLVGIAGTAAWQNSLISCITSIVFFYLIYRLMRRFPGQHIYEVFEAVLGKFLSTIIGVLFSAYAVFYAGSNLREFVEMIKAYNLPYTPTSLIIACVIFVSLVLCYNGLECLVRVAVICFIPTILGIAIILLLAAPSYDALLLRPLWGYGITNTVISGFLRSSGYSEILLLAVINKSLQGVNHFKKAGFISLIVSGILFVVSTMLYVMAFGYPLAQEKVSGLFELSRNIYFNRFFQRVESIFLFIWVISSIITVAATIYIALSSYCKIFKLKNHRPLILPVAFLTFMTAMLPNNLLEVIEINIQIIRQYSMLWLYLIPVFVLIIAVIFKKKGGNVSEKNV